MLSALSQLVQRLRDEVTSLEVDGFTILEVLIAIVIMGILAGFVLTQVGGVKEKAYVDAMMNDLRNYALEQEQYFQEHDRYMDTTEARIEGFHYTEDVFPTEQTLTTDPHLWHLKVGHRKTPIRCELAYSHEDPAGDGEIHCPGFSGPSGSNEGPTADFSFNPSPANQDEAVVFDGTASSDPDGTIDSYLWDFGDGAASGSGPTPSHTYASTGTYNVTLFVTDNEGQSASSTQQVTVQVPPPSASFTFSPAEPNENETVSFDASSSSADAGIASYSWDLDGVSASGVTTSHDFGTADGPHPIQLVVVDNNGRADTATQTLVVNDDPTASFTWSPSSPEAGSSASFDGSGSSDTDGTIASYSWDFDNDGVEDATGPQPSHTFSSSGSHDVTLTVTDDDGAADSSTRAVSVTAPNSPPTASFTFSPSSPIAGQQVDFDGLGSFDPEGGALSYSWDFDNDGVEDATGPQPSHTFSSAGSHDVTLTVTDPEGAADSDTQTVSVAANSAPTASFTWSPSGPETGESVAFDGTGSSDGDGTVTGYSWDFDNDGVEDATGPQPSHSFSSSGSHDVTLTVTDDLGATGSSTQAVSVTAPNGAPTASFTFSPNHPDVGQSVAFDGSGSSDSDGMVTGYSWDFDNDGVEDATGQTPSHTFSSSGSHDVTLTVTDDGGDTDSATQTVDVNGPPSPSFTFSPNHPNEGQSVSFNGSGSTDADGTVSSYSWDFTNNGSQDATGQTTSISYGSGGSKTVELTVTDDDGLSASTTRTITVNHDPNADFTFSPSSPEEGESVSFTDNSSDTDGSVVSYSWNFGDGSPSSSNENPSHTYSSDGTYTVTLTVTDDDGATDNRSRQVTVEAAANPLNVVVTDPADGAVFTQGESGPFGGQATQSGGTNTISLTVDHIDPSSNPSLLCNDSAVGSTSCGDPSTLPTSDVGTNQIHASGSVSDASPDSDTHSYEVQQDPNLTWSCSASGTGEFGDNSGGASGVNRQTINVSASTSDVANMTFSVRVIDYDPGVENTFDESCSGRRGRILNYSPSISGTGEGWTRTSAYHLEEQLYEWGGSGCNWVPSSPAQIDTQGSASGSGNGSGTLLFADTGANDPAVLTVSVPTPSGSSPWSETYTISSSVDTDANTTLTFSCTK